MNPDTDTVTAYIVGVLLVLGLLLTGTVMGRYILRIGAIALACCAAAAIFVFDYLGSSS